MGEVVEKIWKLLEIPAIWGGILTVVVVGMGVLLKQVIAHMLDAQLQRIKNLQTVELTEKVFVRDLYIDGIKDYSSKQALALREAYLLFFEESHSGRQDIAGKDFDIKLNETVQMVMTPLRKHLGILDEETIKKIYDVQHYLYKFQSLEKLKSQKIEFFNVTDMARQFVKADQIAFRLGLIKEPLKITRLSKK